MKKIKAGIIGTGFIGIVHAEALRRVNNVEIAALCDSNAKDAEKKAEDLHVGKFYTDYRQMINDPDIECVHICTPNHLHYRMTKDALSAGKHVVCEKPVTTNIPEAFELLELAEKNNLVNAIGFNVRYYPLMRELRVRMEQGDLGDVFSIQGSYLQDWLFFDTDYNWRLEPDVAGKSRAVADIGSHWIDLVEYVTKRKITAVFADLKTFHKTRKKPLKPVETYSGKLLTPEDYGDVEINTEDYASVLFKLDNGGRGVFTVSQVSAGRKNRIYFDIAGSKKSASWDSEQPNFLWIGKRDGANEILMRDPSLFGEAARELVNYPGGHNEAFPDTFKHLFREVYEDIDREPAQRRNLFPGFADGVRELILCDKILESYEKEKWIEIK